MSTVLIKIAPDAFDSGKPLENLANIKSAVKIVCNNHSPDPSFLGARPLSMLTPTTYGHGGTDLGAYDLVVDINGVELNGYAFEEYLSNEETRMSLLSSLQDLMEKGLVAVYKDATALTPIDLKTFTA